MITRQAFHTYRNEFPLILTCPDRCQVPSGHDLNQIFRNQILDLSDFSTALPFTYLTRHTDDKTPDAILDEFRTRFPGIASACGDGWALGIPTIWFVCYSYHESKIGSVINGFTGKGIRHYPEAPNYYDSFDSIPPDGCYTLTQNEASVFPKFLHQVTQIGLDLLNSSDQGVFLREYQSLEYRQSSNPAELESMFDLLKSELRARSAYYRAHIETMASEHNEFCTNFGRVNGNCSWPHFLFNITGA